MENKNASSGAARGSTGSTSGGNGMDRGMDAGNANSGASGGQGQSSQGQSSQGQTAQSLTDRAKDIASTAQDKLADVTSTVRDKAGTAKATVADALDTGADKLRQRMGGGQLAGATGTGVASLDDGRLNQMGQNVAGGMNATADWLRDADLDGLKSSLERQVKEHPGRTLLIAVGVGYLLGKALRGK